MDATRRKVLAGMLAAAFVRPARAQDPAPRLSADVGFKEDGTYSPPTQQEFMGHCLIVAKDMATGIRFPSPISGNLVCNNQILTNAHLFSDLPDGVRNLDHVVFELYDVEGNLIGEAKPQTMGYMSYLYDAMSVTHDWAVAKITKFEKSEVGTIWEVFAKQGGIKILPNFFNPDLSDPNQKKSVLKSYAGTFFPNHLEVDLGYHRGDDFGMLSIIPVEEDALGPGSSGGGILYEGAIVGLSSRANYDGKKAEAMIRCIEEKTGSSIRDGSLLKDSDCQKRLDEIGKNFGGTISQSPLFKGSHGRLKHRANEIVKIPASNQGFGMVIEHVLLGMDLKGQPELARVRDKFVEALTARGEMYIPYWLPTIINGNTPRPIP